MAENEGVGVTSNREVKENAPEAPAIVSSSPYNVPKSSSAINSNTLSGQQLSTSNLLHSSASNGLTSEQRRQLIIEAEQQRTEQRRLQLLESQRRAEEQREKLREERKRRIEETKKREEARQKKALETKKELERQHKDHLLMLSQRGSSAATSNQSRQMPAVMRASHMSTRSHTAGPSSSTNGDRMATSFTVAFGSSAPRSICTKANEAVLRSQAAFEARLASYLNGRHSGCFLTQSSTYTTYALYVKPDLLPEDHPIRRHHLENYQLNTGTPRRAISANPALCTAMKPTPSSGVAEDRSKAVTEVSQFPEQQHRSRPTVRIPLPSSGAGESGQLVPIRRAVSSRHFAEPTIAFSRKVRGTPPPEVSRKWSGDGPMPKRRNVPGRSTVPRDRCYSYAAPTTAWTNRQRANSQDRRPTSSANEDRTGMTTSVITLPRRKAATTVSVAEVGRAGGETRSRSKLREQPPTISTKTVSAVPFTPTKTTPPRSAAAKKFIKPHAAEVPAGIAKQAKPVQPSSSLKSGSPSPPLTAVESEPIQPPSKSANSMVELQDTKSQPSQSVYQPPLTSLATELDLPAAPPPPPEAPPEPTIEAAPEEAVEDSLDEPIVYTGVSEVAAGENGEVVEEQSASESEGIEERRTSEPKIEEPLQPKLENGYEDDIQRLGSLEDIKNSVKIEAVTHEESVPPNMQQQIEDTHQKSAVQLSSGPLKASTTGSGEGGCLNEEEAAIYRAKMAEQRRLAKERLAEQQRREAEAEKERKERRVAERQAAIEAARERAIEEARLAAEARMAREAAEEEARLQAERKAQERADKERQALEAMMRERSERIRKSEEEREMRRKRLESILSRVNRSDRSLSRGVPVSSSAGSLTGSVAAVSGDGADDAISKTTTPPSAVHFSLGPTNAESSNVFQTTNGESGDGLAPGFRSQQNGFSEAPRTTFNSPLLTSLFSGGGLGANSRLTGATNSASAMTTSDNIVSTSNEKIHSDEVQQPPTTNLPMGTVWNASSS